MSEQAVEGTTVTTEVTVPDVSEPETVAVPDVTVVNVDVPDTDSDTSTVVNHEGRLVRIETMVEQLVTLVSANTAATAQAYETAEVALDIATEPEPEPEPEPDRVPEKPHPLHRSWRELMGK